MNKAGWPFVIIGAVVTILLIALFFIVGAGINFLIIGLSALIITLFFCYFFRDPVRVLPDEETAVISPADGKVVDIIELNDKDVGECTMVGIFMSLLDVHVNRSPFDGEVLSSEHYPGKFKPAFAKGATEENEQQITLLKTEQGVIKIAQIAGVLARRIVSYVEPGDCICRGERIGLIKFGSRVNIYLPRNITIKVAHKQRVKATETVIAELKL